MGIIQLNTAPSNPIDATQPMDGVSENYGFIQTRPLVDLLENQGFTLQSSKVARVLKAEKQGKQKHELRFTFGESDGDSVLQLRMINSHDRTSALSFHLGWFRFVCENGLVVGSSIAESFKVYHVGRNLNRSVLDVVGRVMETAPKLTETKALWTGLTMSADERAFFSKAAAEMLKQEFGKTLTVDSSVRLASPIRYEDDNLWTAYNAIQESIVSGDYTLQSTNQNGVTRRIKARSIKSIDADIKINRMLFDLTDGMARAKLNGEVLRG